MRNSQEQEIRLRAGVLKKCVNDAGAVLTRYFGKIGLKQASSKGGRSINLVSIADTQAQQSIVKTIQRHFPDDLLLGEEGDLSRLRHESAALREKYLWVIDPCDGTVNFLHGFPMFCVSIAVTLGGKPVLAAILDPIRKELFWAERGKGAYCNGKRILVSRPQRLQDALMITGFSYDRQEKAYFYVSYYREFLKVCHDVRRTGSACIDLAWLAAGRSDGYWEWKLNPWDVAAGALLVQEAGGKITRFDGSPYDIFNCEQTLATNGKIHPDCLEIFQKLKENPSLG